MVIQCYNLEGKNTSLWWQRGHFFLIYV
jgi:hypothetical protein